MISANNDLKTIRDMTIKMNIISNDMDTIHKELTILEDYISKVNDRTTFTNDAIRFMYKRIVDRIYEIEHMGSLGRALHKKEYNVLKDLKDNLFNR